MEKGKNQVRRLLLLGFGGLLLLLALTGFVALSVLGNIETRNEKIREDYVNRDRILEQLRSGLYLAGTYARDFLMEPDPAKADSHRRELYAAQARVRSALADYKSVLTTEEQAPIEKFGLEVNAYFSSMQTAMQWNAGQRRRLGFDFAANSVLPRRLSIVHLADQIGQLNHEQMETGSRQITAIFARFRKSLIVILLITLVLGGLLAAVSFDRILRLERLSDLRFEEITSARGALRHLSARLVEVQELERRALSRELHDQVGQSLSAVLIGLGNAAASLPDEGVARAREQLNELRRLTEKTVAEVRDMSLLLRPSMLDDLGLVPALEWQAREVSRTSNLSVEVKAENVSDNLPEEQRTCIYRLTQEALRNVVRHAAAKHAEVRLMQDARYLNLIVQDDGKGFNPDRQKGVGIVGMEERVTHLSGTLKLDSHPGSGTTLTVTLPYSP